MSVAHEIESIRHSIHWLPHSMRVSHGTMRSTPVHTPSRAPTMARTRPITRSVSDWSMYRARRGFTNLRTVADQASQHPLAVALGAWIANGDRYFSLAVEVNDIDPLAARLG